MSFFTEPTGYEKTILSDLQGAWQVLRQEIIDSENTDCLEKMLFHIDEATSWETVRHLETMKPMITLIRNIAVQSKVSAEIMDCIADINEILDEVLKSYNRKKV